MTIYLIKMVYNLNLIRSFSTNVEFIFICIYTMNNANVLISTY